jgi:hypothetical protein
MAYEFEGSLKAFEVAFPPQVVFDSLLNSLEKSTGNAICFGIASRIMHNGNLSVDSESLFLKHLSLV